MNIKITGKNFNTYQHLEDTIDKKLEKLEKYFLSTEKYVTIDVNNSAAFSFEYMSLFVLICNEIDAVLNELCEYYEGGDKSRFIFEKMDALVREGRIPNLCNAAVHPKAEYRDFSFVPFSGFVKGDDGKWESSKWWKSYNNIKHCRSKKDKNGRPYYYRANLKNVFEALAALYLLLSLLYDRCAGDDLPDFRSLAFERITM